MVITGNYRGQSGEILTVDVIGRKVIVDGVNIVKRHTKPTAKNPDGGILEKPAFIDISNVMLVDPKSGKPTRIGYKISDNGEKVRYAKKSGEKI